MGREDGLQCPTLETMLRYQDGGVGLIDSRRRGVPNSHEMSFEEPSYELYVNVGEGTKSEVIILNGTGPLRVKETSSAYDLPYRASSVGSETFAPCRI